MGRRSETGGVKPAGDRIEVRLTWQGKDIRPTLSLKPTAANLKHARRLREQIVREIAAGAFDLGAHFPDYKFRERHQPAAEGRRTVAQWAVAWERLSVRTLEHSTLRIYARHLAAYWLPTFGWLYPEQVTHLAVLDRLAELATDHVDAEGVLHKGLSRKTQNNILIPLRAVFALICRPPSRLADPTEGIGNLKVQKAAPDPFSPQEVEVILADLLKHDGAEAADYFEFACFAGLRVSEQIALLWPDVDLRTRAVAVRRAFVLGREKERTKTSVERLVELNDRAAAVIERQRARTQLAGGVVFRNPITGRPWAGEQEQRRIWMRCLRRCGVRHRPPKECRDTSVTLALLAGADAVWVAGQHGHSVTVMMRDYAKWIPRADRGRNLAAVNSALRAALEPRQEAEK